MSNLAKHTSTVYRLQPVTTNPLGASNEYIDDVRKQMRGCNSHTVDVYFASLGLAQTTGI